MNTNSTPCIFNFASCSVSEVQRLNIATDSNTLLYIADDNNDNNDNNTGRRASEPKLPVTLTYLSLLMPTVPGPTSAETGIAEY